MSLGIRLGMTFFWKSRRLSKLMFLQENEFCKCITFLLGKEKMKINRIESSDAKSIHFCSLEKFIRIDLSV